MSNGRWLSEEHGPHWLVGSASEELQVAWCAGVSSESRVTDLAELREVLVKCGVQTGTAWLARLSPREFDPEAFQRLAAEFPLVRWVSVFGDWCDGELRSGWPLPGVERIELAELVDLVEVRLRSERRLATWLPASAQPVDHWLAWGKSAEVDEAVAEGEAERVNVGIVTEHRAGFEGLAGVIADWGFRGEWWPRGEFDDDSEVAWREAAGVLIVDFEFGVGEGIDLEWLDRDGVPERRLGLVGFPRHQDGARLGRLGFQSLLPKPFRIDTLRSELMRLVDPSGSDAKSGAGSRVSGGWD